MRLSLCIDRFEVDEKKLPVLMDASDRVVNWPRSMLPAGVRTGEILNFTIDRDPGATMGVSDETKRVHGELGRRDPGGDLTL